MTKIVKPTTKPSSWQCWESRLSALQSDWCNKTNKRDLLHKRQLATSVWHKKRGNVNGWLEFPFTCLHMLFMTHWFLIFSTFTGAEEPMRQLGIKECTTILSKLDDWSRGIKDPSSKWLESLVDPRTSIYLTTCCHTQNKKNDWPMYVFTMKQLMYVGYYEVLVFFLSCKFTPFPSCTFSLQ